MTLAEFLLARLADDDAGAGHQHHLTCSRIRGGDCGCGIPASIRRWSEVGRQLLALHKDAGGSQGFTDNGYEDIPQCCWACGSFGEYGVAWPCRTVRALAQLYDQHPDYDQAWRVA